jgi:hypothetical protein
MLRLLAVVGVGVATIVLTGFLIDQLQTLLERIGYPLPRPIFLGMLVGAVVYVAKSAMDWATRELKRYQAGGKDAKTD